MLPPLRGCQRSLEATGSISPLGDKDRSKQLQRNTSGEASSYRET